MLQLSVSEKESERKFEVNFEPRLVTQRPSVTIDGCCCKLKNVLGMLGSVIQVGLCCFCTDPASVLLVRERGVIVM